MFEHRGGHPAPPGARTASRLPHSHGSLALSITDATVYDQRSSYIRLYLDCIDIALASKCDCALDCGRAIDVLAS